MRKTILYSLLSLVLLPPASAGQAARPDSTLQEPGTPLAPATDHLRTWQCHLTEVEHFTSYELRFHADYTDGKPNFDMFVEKSSDLDALYDECRAFELSMSVAQLDEKIAESKASFKKMKDDHFLLKAKK